MKETFVESNPKILIFSQNTDADQLLRFLCNEKVKSLNWISKRAHVLAQTINFVLDSNENAKTGTLQVSGFLRGCSMSANQLVHLPNCGDFQLEKITLAKFGDQKMEDEEVLDTPDASQVNCL